MSVWQTTAPMWLWQHSCEDESRKLTDGISDLFVFHCDFFCRTKMLMMIYRVRSFLRSPPSRMNTAWCEGARGPRSSWLESKVCERGATPAPSPVPAVMSALPRWLDTHTGKKHCQAWQVCEGAACTVTIPPLNPPPPFEMPPPFSPTVLSPSHHPVPFPLEQTAICALRKTPPFVVFFAGSLIHFFSVFWLAGCCWRGSQTVSCQRPPNKPALVHRPPPSDKISSKAAIWEDLCWFILNFRTDYSVCGGLKTVITRPYTFCNWGHFNWIELYWIFGSLGATQEPLQEPWGSPKPHLESHCSSRIESKRRTERERERVAT